MSSDQSTTENYLYAGYEPNFPACIVFIGLYIVVGLIHWYHWFRNRKRYMLVLCIGMICMAAGFLFRAIYAKNLYTLIWYILQQLFILLSPCAFIACNYMLLTRLACALECEDLLFIKARIVVRLFVWSDVITFFIQASGGGLSAKQDAADIGKYITLTGLALQLMAFSTFSALTIVFGIRVKSQRRYIWDCPAPLFSRGSKTNWKLLYYVLLLSIVGILVRTCYRLAEYTDGYHSYLATTESYLYCLDILPVFLAVCLYAVVWPSTWLDNATLPPNEQHYPLKSRPIPV